MRDACYPAAFRQRIEHGASSPRIRRGKAFRETLVHWRQDVAGFVSAKLSTLPGVLSTATHFNLKTYKIQGVLREDVVNEERLKVSP